jgi:GAF domain-containing protein
LWVRRPDDAEENVEPIAETEAALQEYLEADDTDLDCSLREMAEAACGIVPECVGLSLTLVRDQLTFTLVASDEPAAVIDAAQYLDGGPCMRDDVDAKVRELRMAEALDEGRWTLFARTSAAHGVASSLSLAVMQDGLVVGGINLYASEPDAFSGHHDALAGALGASAEGAVADADLSFLTRRMAQQAPTLLRENRDVEVAVGLLAARYGESVEAAEARLGTAAGRAGVPVATVARVLVALHQA